MKLVPRKPPKFIHYEHAAASESQSLKVSPSHWSQRDVEKWKGTQLCEYFYDQYLNHVGVTHIYAGQKHVGIMNKLTKKLGDPHEVKRYIDAMFEMKLKHNTIEVFTSAQRLGEIQEYIHSGEIIAATSDSITSPEKSVTPTTSLKDLLGGD